MFLSAVLSLPLALALPNSPFSHLLSNRGRQHANDDVKVVCEEHKEGGGDRTITAVGKCCVFLTCSASLADCFLSLFDYLYLFFALSFFLI